jgi:hypothetical protein
MGQTLQKPQYVLLIFWSFYAKSLKNNLPPLTNYYAIMGLSDANANQYAQGYGLGQVATRRQAIAKAIGYCFI